MRRAAALACSLCLLGASHFPGRALADIFEFRRGGRVELEGEVDGDRIILTMPATRYTFLRADFRRIEAGPWPERDWAERSAAVPATDRMGQVELARWAIAQGLTQQALKLIRGFELGADLPADAARLKSAVERFDHPCAEPDVSAITRVLPGKFRQTRGPHVLLLHQHDEAEAQGRVDMIENVIASFYLEFSALGFDLRPLERRLVAVWFAERDNYRAYLERDGAGAFRETRGYHHPARGIVATYDARSDPNVRAALETIAARRGQLAELASHIEKAPRGSELALTLPDGSRRAYSRPAAQGLLEEWTRDTDREALLLELQYRRLNLAPAAHETVHQLVIATGLAARQADFPNWLHEGLAMQFESDRGGTWAGTGTPSNIRLAHWTARANRPTLSSVLSDEGLGGGANRDTYSAAWGWVYFLRREHPETLQRLIDRLRIPSTPDRPARQRARDVILEANGRSLHDWEREWLRFMKNVGDGRQTTKDENRGDPPSSVD